MPPIADGSLPLPDADAQAHSRDVVARVRAEIASAGGWIPFATYMQIALYAPGLGYYASGARKFGAGGDFVTAPELTPLFGRTVAAQLDAIRARSGSDVLELGAGTGKLAADLLASLAHDDASEWRYRILETSPDLRARQRETIERLAGASGSRVEWLDTLPASLEGAVLMNEVLDALPVHVLARRDGRWYERGVAEGSPLTLADRPLEDARLLALARSRFPPDVDYASEVNPAAEALVASLAHRLRSGAIVAIDYGFPRHEYYHPQRAAGTLVAHYRHRVHGDPLFWPGLCDLTAHVDFTAMANAGLRAGLRVAGFTTQAGFLLGCGVVDQLRAEGPPDSMPYLTEAAAVQKLLSPAEMGELFKVLALERGDAIDWPGFRLFDMTHRLRAGDSD